MCGGSPSPALAQSPDEEPPRPTATPTLPVPKYRDILVAYLTDPNERLGPVRASVPPGTVINFRMVPARDEWQLMYIDNRAFQYGPEGNKGDMRWRCVSTTNSAIDMTAGRGRVFNYTVNTNWNVFLRGVVAQEDGDACEVIHAYGPKGEEAGGGRPNTSVSVPDNKLAVKTRALYLDTGGTNRGKPDVPPGFDGPTLQTVDDLIYQAPGGHWTTQMLVSFGASVVVMIILRSMVGLMVGILLMPVTAYGMFLIGYGSGWYVIVLCLLFVFSAVAWGLVIRRA